MSTESKLFYNSYKVLNAKIRRSVAQTLSKIFYNSTLVWPVSSALTPTIFDITLTSNLTEKLALSISAGSVDISWGDGTTTNVALAHGVYSHTYSAAGNYSIELLATSSSASWKAGFSDSPMTAEEAAEYGYDSGDYVTLFGIAGNNKGNTSPEVLDISWGDGFDGFNACALEGCTSLTSVDIPDNVTEISINSFFGCTSLTSYPINSHITTIGNAAYQNLTGANTSLILPSSVTFIDAYAFSGSAITGIAIPNSLASIGNRAFMNCQNLTSVTLSSSLTSIGQYTFSGCTSLTQITIPSGVTVLEHGVFMNTGFVVFTIPDHITTVDDAVFGNCHSLTTINIGSGVTSLYLPTSSSNSWFALGAENLIAINVDSGNSTYASLANSLTNKAKTEILKYPPAKYIGTWIPGVPVIGYRAFQGSTGLGRIILAELTEVKDYAFYQSGITYAYLDSSNVASATIGVRAFERCSSLTDVYLGDGIGTFSPSPANGGTVNSHQGQFSRCDETLLTIHCEPQSKPNYWWEYFNAYRTSSGSPDVVYNTLWGETMP